MAAASGSLNPQPQEPQLLIQLKEGEEGDDTRMFRRSLKELRRKEEEFWSRITTPILV
jgi:hypothetical protein